jgi:hypothetical protein
MVALYLAVPWPVVTVIWAPRWTLGKSEKGPPNVARRPKITETPAWPGSGVFRR